MMKQVTPQALPAPLMQFENPTTSTDLCANSDKMLFFKLCLNFIGKVGISNKILI